jgi:putative oxidoreductase
MKKLIQTITNTNPEGTITHVSLLIFRILLSVELIVAHGLKKIGVGVSEAEQVPNPLHLPEAFNSLFADAANLVFPVFVIFGFHKNCGITHFGSDSHRLFYPSLE